MDVVRLLREEQWVDRISKTTTVVAIEADGGAGGHSRDVQRTGTCHESEINGLVPQRRRHTAPSVRATDVEERKPCQEPIESRIDDGDAEKLIALVGRQQGSAIGHALTTELDLRREAVGPFADRLPCRDVGHGDRAFRQVPVHDHVLDVDILRPVDQRHDANVVDREPPQLHSDPAQDSLVSTSSSRRTK